MTPLIPLEDSTFSCWLTCTDSSESTCIHGVLHAVHTYIFTLALQPYCVDHAVVDHVAGVRATRPACPWLCGRLAQQLKCQMLTNNLAGQPLPFSVSMFCWQYAALLLVPSSPWWRTAVSMRPACAFVPRALRKTSKVCSCQSLVKRCHKSYIANLYDTRNAS